MLMPWELPGPSTFVKKAGQDLSDGCNIIFVMPEVHPEGLRRRLDSVLADHSLEIIDIHLDEWRERGCTTPEQILTELFSIEVKGNEIFSKVIAESPQFRDERHVIWVDGVTEFDWNKWKQFIEEYEHPSRGIDEWERTVFAIQLVGEVANNLPKNRTAVALKTHSFFHGVINRIDTLLFVAGRLGETNLTACHRMLRQNMLVELAGTDLDLAERFCQESLSHLSEPFIILQDVAIKRGWDKFQPMPANALTGTFDIFDGQDYVNSAYLAVCDKENEIVRRLWRAQLSVIFPMLEEKRIKFISRLRGQIPLPFDTRYGAITNENELELSHLHYLAKGNKISIDRSTFKTLEKLKEMRNALAHSEIIPQEYLNDTQLFRPGI